MPEQINTWEKGLNSDLSKGVLQKSNYTNARNWHLITEEGSSTVALENVKGNRIYFSFPDLPPVYKFQISPSNPINLGDVYIVINYQAKLFPNPGTSSLESYFKALSDFINNEFGSIKASYQEDGVLIYSLSVSLIFGGALYGTTTVYVQAQANLRPIGWTMMRNDFIILTTNSLTGGPGQIWRLSYDSTTLDSTYTSTLTLLYNNNINFAIQHPVASPGAIVGRYENTNIQNIYWTDFFNNPRKFNTVDPNGFGVLSINLNMFPSVEMGIPILDVIILGGQLYSGIYQYAYRLSTDTGQSSSFSPLSNIIPVTDVDENSSLTNLSNYDGVGALDINGNFIQTGKKIKCTIRGLDTDYTKIEVVFLRRNTNADLPLIESFLRDEPVPSDGVYTFEHSGTEVNVSLTLDEFTTFKGNLIDKCKTMTSKDNLLLIGNIKESQLDVDYDARAFRYNSTQTSYGSPTTVPDEQDDINTNQDFSNSSAFLYQSDGLTIGGTGTNISYKIKQADMLYDQYYLGDGFNVSGGSWDSLAAYSADAQAPPRTPFRSTDKKTHNHNLGIPDQNYHHGWFFDTFVSPWNHGLFKGYMRDETYRFGILFYDKNMNPGFVKWISDIRMPKVYDVSGNIKYPIVTVYDNEVDSNAGNFSNGYSTVSPSPHLWRFGSPITGHSQPWTKTHPVYLEMSVNISATIRDQIGGFSIVRAERGQGNKTILSQGVIFPIHADYARKEYYAGDNDFGNPDAKSHTGFFPESFFHDDMSFISGDKLRPVSVLYPTVKQNVSTLNTTVRGARILKLYDHTIPSVSESSINNFNLVLSGGTTSITDQFSLGSSTFRNYSRMTVVTTIAQKSALLELQDENHEITGQNVSPSPTPILVNYVRENSSQYGGNTVSQRSQTKYISCGHFQPINENSPLSFTFSLYGGDTFTPIWDFQRTIRSLGGGYNDIRNSQAYFVPLETTIDIDTRQGVTINRSGLDEFADQFAPGSFELFDPTRPIANDEDIVAHPYYDYENTIRKFTSKPVDFITSLEFDNRVRASEAKTNGEVDDNWVNFDPLIFIDVDGIYGPINNLVPFKDNIIYFQTNAFGKLIVNPRSVVPDVQGDELQMARGGILEDYQYISNEIGCFHQWGMITSDTSIFFWDSKRKKIYQFGEGVKPLSDLKGLQAFFANNLTGDVNISDNPLISGVCATYDYRFNEAIFTFKDVVSQVKGTIVVINNVNAWLMNLPQSYIDGLKVGDIITIVLEKVTLQVTVMEIQGNQIRIGTKGGSFLGASGTVTINISTTLKTTIAYSEPLDVFSSFYSFAPDMYLNDKRIILTPKPGQEKSLYLHNEFDYNNFYGTLFSSTLSLVVNPGFKETKTFDNLEWFTEVTKGGVDKLETFNKLKCKTGYQESTFDTLTINQNVKRRERTWSIQVPRGEVRERLRDKYLEIDLVFDNPGNRRILMHYLNTHFRNSIS